MTGWTPMAPAHWRRTTVGAATDTKLGRMLNAEARGGPHQVPYLRNENVRWGGFDLSDVNTMSIPPERRHDYRLEPGDVLVCEGGDIGRAAVWTQSGEPMYFQKALHRIRVGDDLDAAFVRYWLEHLALSNRLVPYATGSTILHLPQQSLRKLPLLIPPLDEQRAIIETVQRMTSRVEAATAGLSRLAATRLQLERSLYAALYREAGAVAGLVTVGDLLERIEAGKSYKCPGHAAAPDKAGVLKLGAVTWGEYNQSENKELPPDARPDPRWEVRAGDLLLGRANTAEHVGATALVRTTRPGLYLSDKTLRLVPREGVAARWVKAALAAPQSRAQMSEVATGTSDSMRNISQAKITAVAVPDVPDDFAVRLDSLDAELVRARRLAPLVGSTLERRATLRRAILKAAFEGRLTGAARAARSAVELEEAIA